VSSGEFVFCPPGQTNGRRRVAFQTTTDNNKNKELFEAAAAFRFSLFILLMCGGILPVCPIHYVTHPSGKSEALKKKKEGRKAFHKSSANHQT
jgi:hypothetical protein